MYDRETLDEIAKNTLEKMIMQKPVSIETYQKTMKESISTFPNNFSSIVEFQIAIQEFSEIIYNKVKSTDIILQKNDNALKYRYWNREGLTTSGKPLDDFLNIALIHIGPRNLTIDMREMAEKFKIFENEKDFDYSLLADNRIKNKQINQIEKKEIEVDENSKTKKKEANIEDLALAIKYVRNIQKVINSRPWYTRLWDMFTGNKTIYEKELQNLKDALYKSPLGRNEIDRLIDKDYNLAPKGKYNPNNDIHIEEENKQLAKNAKNKTELAKIFADIVDIVKLENEMSVEELDKKEIINISDDVFNEETDIINNKQKNDAWIVMKQKENSEITKSGRNINYDIVKNDDEDGVLDANDSFDFSLEENVIDDIEVDNDTLNTIKLEKNIGKISPFRTLVDVDVLDNIDTLTYGATVMENNDQYYDEYKDQEKETNEFFL